MKISHLIELLEGPPFRSKAQWRKFTHEPQLEKWIPDWSKGVDYESLPEKVPARQYKKKLPVDQRPLAT